MVIFFVFYQDLVVFLPIGEAVKSQEKCLALEKGNQTWNGCIGREIPIFPLHSIAFQFPGEGSHRHFSLAAWMPGTTHRDRKGSRVRVIQLGWGARGGCRLPREDVGATPLQVLMDGLDGALRNLRKRVGTR